MDRSPDFSQIKQLAQSESGRQLLQLLRQNGGSKLEQALSLAAGGDYTQAKELLTPLLASPEAKRILQQLEGSL